MFNSFKGPQIHQKLYIECIIQRLLVGIETTSLLRSSHGCHGLITLRFMASMEYRVLVTETITSTSPLYISQAHKRKSSADAKRTIESTY